MQPGAAPLAFMLLLSLFTASTAADTANSEQVQIQTDQVEKLHPAAPVICPDGSPLTACSCEADSCLRCLYCTLTVQQQQQQQRQQIQQTPETAAAHQIAVQTSSFSLPQHPGNRLQQQQRVVAAPIAQRAAGGVADLVSMQADVLQQQQQQQQQQRNVLHKQQTWAAAAIAAGRDALPNDEPRSSVLSTVEQQQKQKQQPHVPSHSVSDLPAGSGKQTTANKPLPSSTPPALADGTAQQQPDAHHVGLQEKAAAAAADASGVITKVQESAAQAAVVQQQQYLFPVAVTEQPPLDSSIQHLHDTHVALAAAEQQQQQQRPQQPASIPRTTRQVASLLLADQLPQSDPDVYVTNTARPPTSQAVGSRFSFRVEVGVRGLASASAAATNIVLESELPEGLLIARYGVDETFIPFENACAVVTASSYRCDWPQLRPSEERVIEVTAIARQAGSYRITATVRSSSTDNNAENNESTARIQALGACCDRQSSVPGCRDVLGSANCPPGSTFIPSQCCQRIRCEESNAGACCLKWGSCVDRTYPSACQSANGTWHADTTCAALRKQGQCKAATGACCNVRDGQCTEGVAVAACDLKSSTWWVGGSCASDGYCSGACCDAQRQTCYPSRKVDCQQAAQRWSLYGQCDPLTCPVGDGCAAAWHRCKPGQFGGFSGADDCCPGYECVEAPRGSKVGKYVCQPKLTLTCGTEGMSCGGKSSAMCCQGYACWWDQGSHKGSCWPQPDPDTCAQDGSSCHHDRDCCYGSRCYFRHSRRAPGSGGKPRWAEPQPAWGQCVPVSFEKCHKDCFDYNCYVERQRDCNALYATAAARL